MNGNKRKGLLIVFVLIVLVIAAVGSWYFITWKDHGVGKDVSGENLVQSDGGSDNLVSGEVIRIDGVKRVGDIEFSNIQIRKINNSKCEFTADVKNLTKEFLEETKVRIKVVGDEEKEARTFGGIVTELAGLEPNTFKTFVLTDISDAVDVEIEVVDG